jgi:hypothetical protein
MWKLLSFSTAVALIVYLVSGLVPLKYVPHDHLLIGFVTAAQLREHEQEEALAMQAPVETDVSTQGLPGVAVTGTGGLIISVAPPLAASISALHVEIAIQFAILLFLPLVFRSIALLRVFPQAITLPLPDPPPRRITAPV